MCREMLPDSGGGLFSVKLKSCGISRFSNLETTGENNSDRLKSFGRAVFTADW